MHPAVTLGILVSIATLLAFITTWWVKAGRPRWKAATRFLSRLDETINGRPAEHDAYGRQTSVAIPPLSEQMSGIRSTVDMLVERDERLTALETTVAEHGQRLTAIEAGHQIERSLGHVAQAKVMDAIGEVAKTSRDDADHA